MKYAIACLLLVACGDNLPERGDAHSGARLKLAWYVYDGGARERELNWLYDAALQQRCVIQAWSDGHRYCAPTADAAVYVSDTCMRAVGRTAAGVPPAAYAATTFWLSGEPRPSRLFQRGASTLPPTSIWRKTTDGCIGPFEPGDNFAYYDLGDELFVSDLAAIRETEPQGDGELAVILDTSSDGLRVPAALYHRDAARQCTTNAQPNAARLECVPVSTPSAVYFHDAACTAPVLNTADASTPTLASRLELETSCVRYYDVGDEVTAPPLFVRTGSGCLAIAPPDGQRFYAMAGAHAMPALERRHDVSEQRVQGITLVNGDLHLRDAWMYDVELDTECGHDSELRCAPRTSIAVQPFYADAQCQTPMNLALVPRGECDPAARFATDGTDYYSLVAPYPSTIYVPSTGDTCGIFQPPTPLVAYTLGEPLDRSRLPRAELTIDP